MYLITYFFNMKNYIKELEIENLIWIIYIFISILAIISNYYEKKYYYFKIFKDKEKYRQINMTIFTIALIIYLYFYYLQIKNKSTSKNENLKTYANLLFIIAGAIFLFTEYQIFSEEIATI